MAARPDDVRARRDAAQAQPEVLAHAGDLDQARNVARQALAIANTILNASPKPAP